MSKIVFYITRKTQKEERVNLHSHNCWEIVYYFNGNGSSRIDGKEVSFSSSTFALLPPLCPHDEHHESDGRLCYIGFESDSPLPAAGIYGDELSLPFKHTVQRFFEEAQGHLPGSERMMELLLQELILLLGRLQGRNKEPVQDFSHAKRFLSENYSSHIRLTELARSYGYTYDYFRHKFKEECGLSPQAYLMEIRLREACKLLEHGQKNCTEIAYLCGFSDSAQFSNLFKARYGISPKKYLLQKKEPL